MRTTGIALVAAFALLAATDLSMAQSRGECTKRCGGTKGGCAINTVAVQACFNKCMGTNECPAGQSGGKKKS